MERKHHGLKSNRTRVYRMEQKKKHWWRKDRSYVKLVGWAHAAWWVGVHILGDYNMCACKLVVVPVLLTSICVLNLCHDLQTLFNSLMFQTLKVIGVSSQWRHPSMFHPVGPVPVRWILKARTAPAAGGGRRSRGHSGSGRPHIFFFSWKRRRALTSFQKKKERKTDLSIKESRLSRQHLYEAGLAWFVTQWGRRVWRGSWWLFVKILWSSSVSNSHTKKYPTGWCFSTTHIPFSTSRSTCVATFSKRLLLGRT